MNCQRTAATFAAYAARILTLFFVWLTLIIAFVHSVAAIAQAPSSKSSDTLRQALAYQIQFRSGKSDFVPQYVALLEEATKAEPDNADLWCAMGTAYLTQTARALMPGGNPADAMSGMQKGPSALRRALQINPNHAEAMSRLGGIQAMMASFMQAPQMAARGIAQMNRAVELAPDSVRVRLQRAFSGLSLPDVLRNNAAEAEDLDFLIGAAAADASNAGDYVRIMRGDLYFEMGNADLALAMYKTAESSASLAGADAKARLAAMTHGGVPASDIKSLRTAAGAQCAMCHAN